MTLTAMERDERARAAKSLYRERHLEQERDRSRKYRERHRDEINARARERYRTDGMYRAQKLDYSERWRAEHPERYRELQKAYRERKKEEAKRCDSTQTTASPGR